MPVQFPPNASVVFCPIDVAVIVPPFSLFRGRTAPEELPSRSVRSCSEIDVVLITLVTDIAGCGSRNAARGKPRFAGLRPAGFGTD
jgi:hypothetical protein